MIEAHTSEARERVLAVAERLFMERGYNAVSLRDVATELGMQKASLYNHAPGGKESLFITIVERSLARHAYGINQALLSAPADLASQLQAIARWLFSQPPMYLQRLQVSDKAAIHPSHADRVMMLVFQTFISPIEQCVRQAIVRNEVNAENTAILAGTYLAALESIRALGQSCSSTKEVMIDQLITLLLEGAKPR